jgi:GNAT superfamily N-acetyltransferase
MDADLSVRLMAPAEWERYRAIRLRALQDSPDSFGSTFEQEAHRPPGFWQERLTSGADARWNCPVFALKGTEPIGLVWGRIERAVPDVASLYQMWVAPDHRGKGAGKMLLVLVIAWAKEAGAIRLELAVAVGESPASRLYSRAGFVPTGFPEPIRPGSSLLAQPMVLNLFEGAA